MNISLEKLLVKMEGELKGARNAATASEMREKVHSLKTLCELVLDEPSQQVQRPAAVQAQAPAAVQGMKMQMPGVQAPQHQYQPVPNQPKRLEMDSEANGESLFDF